MKEVFCFRARAAGIASTIDSDRTASLALKRRVDSSTTSVPATVS